MGLDFTHGDAHWAYGGFHRFRERLAEHEGFDLNAMVGFKSQGGRPWDEVTTDLKPLLNHSDCDGVLTPAECAQVAPRLAKVIAAWDADEYDRRHAEALIEAMEGCARASRSWGSRE